MASTISDRPVRLIRVQPNPVFQEPKHLPIKPLTQAPIEIERPPDYLTSCIHRADFKDIHSDLLKDYAKHYDIEIDHEKVLRAEIMAVLCMKNEWIPILPEHDTTRIEDEQVLLSTTANQSLPEEDGDAPIVVSVPNVESYIPDRFGTPEDSYDNDMGPSTEAADPNSKKSDGDITGDFDFDALPSTISLGDLTKLTSRLQARHTHFQGALRDATAATREAAANVLEMMARLENEKARMKKIMATVSEIVGEYDVEVELNENGDEDVVEVGENHMISEKRKGKERARQPIRSSAHSSFGLGPDFAGRRPSLLCPNCRVARDLTVSQRHSVYLCAEHMPNPYQTNETPNEDSRMSTSATGSSSRSARNDRRSHRRSLDPSSSRDSTIIFGLTTKSVSASNPSSKGKKRSLDEENKGDEGSHSRSTSSKRARVETQDDTQDPTSRQNSSLGSTPVPKKSALTRTMSIDDPANTERGASAPKTSAPLRRTFSISDLNDPNEIARIERMESASSSTPVPLTSAVFPGNLNLDANVERGASTLRRNAPLRRTFSVTNLNDNEELSNAVRGERLEGTRGRHAGRKVTPGVSNSNAVERQRPPTSSRNAPLRRTISIHDLNDLEEVANAEKEESSLPRGIAAPGPTISTDGEELIAIADNPTPMTNEPMRRAFTMGRNTKHPIEVARVESLAAANVELRTAQSQGPQVVDVVSQRTKCTATQVFRVSGSEMASPSTK